MVDDALLNEQLNYYRARAGEYDRWWNRDGRYDRGAEANARWFSETSALEDVLAEFDPRGDVLELACGTGLWTRHLVRYASRLTAVDAAPEVLAINRSRVDDPRVEYVQADLFAWTPPEGAFDACVFSFWLSHVPDDRFAAFWGAVRGALRPGGRVLFIDSARAERSKAVDHVMPSDESAVTESRRLDDGREFLIVKRYYDSGLEGELGALGWDCAVGSTGEFFVYGVASPLPGG
jgi:SAM-dependent methyltransferase